MIIIIAILLLQLLLSMIIIVVLQAKIIKLTKDYFKKKIDSPFMAENDKEWREHAKLARVRIPA